MNREVGPVVFHDQTNNIQSSDLRILLLAHQDKVQCCHIAATHLIWPGKEFLPKEVIKWVNPTAWEGFVTPYGLSNHNT